MSTYQLLQILRDARTEGRLADVYAILDELGGDQFEHRAKVRLPNVNQDALADYFTNRYSLVMPDDSYEMRMRFWTQIQVTQPGYNGVFAV